MRGLLAHRSDAVFLVLGIVGVNVAVTLATVVPGDNGTATAVWPSIGVGVLGVCGLGALWVAIDSTSISIRKFGDRSLGRAGATLRAGAALLSPRTYRQAAALIGVPTAVVFGVVVGSVTMSVVSVVQG
ncbi:MAG: hypothetical protein ABIP21_01865 [Acidimicrobiia bacterium]